MLKICNSAIVKLLTILLKSCIVRAYFQIIGKKSKICPIYKKGYKQITDHVIITNMWKNI